VPLLIRWCSADRTLMSTANTAHSSSWEPPRSSGDRSVGQGGDYAIACRLRHAMLAPLVGDLQPRTCGLRHEETGDRHRAPPRSRPSSRPAFGVSQTAIFALTAARLNWCARSAAARIRASPGERLRTALDTNAGKNGVKQVDRCAPSPTRRPRLAVCTEVGRVLTCPPCSTLPPGQGSAEARASPEVRRGLRAFRREKALRRRWDGGVAHASSIPTAIHFADRTCRVRYRLDYPPASIDESLPPSSCFVASADAFGLSQSESTSCRCCRPGTWSASAPTVHPSRRRVRSMGWRASVLGGDC